MGPPLSFIDLPPELVELIASFLPSQGDVSCFARTHRQHYNCLMKYMLKYDIRHRESSGLQWAAKRNHLPIARCLIQLGADPNAKPTLSTSHWPPLHYSAKYCHVEMLQLLLDAGADPNMQFRHVSALKLACSYGCMDIVQYLLQAGADVNAHTTCGVSPLDSLLVNGVGTGEPGISRRVEELDFDMLLLFLEHGNDPDACSLERGIKHPDPRVRYTFYGRVDFGGFGEGEKSREQGHSATPRWLVRAARMREKMSSMIAPEMSDENLFPSLCGETA